MNKNKLYMALSFLNILLWGGTAFFFVAMGSVCSMTLPGMLSELGCSLIIGLTITFLFTKTFKFHRKIIWWLTCSAPLVYALWGKYYYKFSIPFLSKSVEETLLGLGFLFAVFITPLIIITCIVYISMLPKESQ